MKCAYCRQFQEAKWRVSPDPDENGKKGPKAKMRHCHIVQKYITSDQEECAEGFVPADKFWCERNNQWIHIDACISKFNKGFDETCFNCHQHKEILELVRIRGYLKRKAAKAEAEASKPTLLKRNI